MDKFDNVNWKKIQNIVGSYTGKTPDEPPDPFKITPILAHAPDSLVGLSDSVALFASLDSEEGLSCSYVSTLIKKNEEYIVSLQAYLVSPVGEIPIVYESDVFKKEQKKEITKFMRAPFRYFTRSRHIRVMTFKNSDMQEEDFNNLIELWRSKPPQI